METPATSIPGYRILSVLGRGAMATVYRAEHERLGKEVALKVLDPAVARDPEYRERFLREARAAAKLNHRNIVRALDAGIHESVHWFVMELVRGEDLKARLQREERIAEDEALKISRAVATALVEASRHGIVHRDVKPENILISEEGEVKLADLGLAKSVTDDAHLTRQGYTIGTVAFFSPEQARGESDIDVRTDIYSLGATLYVCLTGELPFGRGSNAPETMRRILKEAPPAVEDLAPETSLAAIQLVERLMAKKREDRPATPQQVIELIDRALSAPRDAPERRRPGTASGARRPRRPSGRLGTFQRWLGGRRDSATADAAWRRTPGVASVIALAAFSAGAVVGMVFVRDARVRAALGMTSARSGGQAR
jgi:serine/threonine-protein kinase